MPDELDRDPSQIDSLPERPDPAAPEVDRTRILRVVLASLPFIGILGGAGLANRTEPFVLGLPFLMAYIVLWVIASSAIMAIIYALDPANRGPQTDDEATPR